MQKELLIAVVLGVLLLVTLVQAVQLNSLNASLASVKSTGLAASQTASATTGVIDMTGWTANEKMNYEMHGTVPARAGNSASSASQVGGC